MPKIVDPEQRRNAIVDALFDVVREGGFANVTLANVAHRAGLAIGSVRHFLGTRDELIGFAFATVAERLRARLVNGARALQSDLDSARLDQAARLTATTDLLCELLPLDPPRRDEAVVWIELETAARTDPHLAEHSRQAAAGTNYVIESILRSAQDRGAIGHHVDITVETARLAALVDGLTLRAVLHPELLDADVARRILTEHLAQLRDTAP